MEKTLVGGIMFHFLPPGRCDFAKDLFWVVVVVYLLFCVFAMKQLHGRDVLNPASSLQ